MWLPVKARPFLIFSLFLLATSSCFTVCLGLPFIPVFEGDRVVQLDNTEGEFSGREKPPLAESEESGFVPLDIILDQFTGFIEAAENGDAPWGAFIDLVNDTVIIDEERVEWRLDPFSLTLFNEDGRLASTQGKKFKAGLRTLANP